MTERYYEIEGFDISYWQGQVDWDRVAELPYMRFVMMRAALSWGYTDPTFYRNWEEAKRIGLNRGAYHVILPTQNVTRQVENFIISVGDEDFGEMPLIIDVETTSDQYDSNGSIIMMKNRWGDALAEEIIQLRAITGKYPIIYTRKSFMDYFVSWRNEFALCPYWLAHYGYKGAPRYAPPAVPTNVPEAMVLFHQYTEGGTEFGDGKFHGLQSSGMDVNGWLKTREEYDIFFNNSTPVHVEDEDEVVDVADIPEDIIQTIRYSRSRNDGSKLMA